jgi:hypothetical protein
VTNIFSLSHIACSSNALLLVAKNVNWSVPLGVNVKSTHQGLVIPVPNVIVYGVAQLLTLNTYTCQAFIVLGLLTVKLAEGVNVLNKLNVILVQLLLTGLKSL